MHFYTLHNQSHAIELIENVNSILKTIDYLKISKFDFYILYIACYLHDISMVLYPNYNFFIKESWLEANKLSVDHLKSIESLNPLDSGDLIKAKRQILDLYKSIEVLFETEVRLKHAKNSATFIRNSNDLNFLEKGIIDYVADVSYSHGMDAKDIYYLKSKASERSVSLKFMMILIRLADLLDMNENRVSVPIFYNNKDKMSEMTKFHWISHIITGRYEFINKYELVSKIGSFLEPNSINETITLQIDIKINQLTTMMEIKNDSCQCVNMVEYNGDDEVILDILDKDETCSRNKCNFVCKWFNKKNNWLILELMHLQEYLGDIEGYFKTKFRIVLKLSDNNILRPEDFDELSKFISK